MTEIEFITGHLGSCKSVLVAKKAYEAYWKGKVLLSNFPFYKLAYCLFRVSDALDFLKRLNPDREYALFWDEAHVEADSHDFMTDKNKEFSYFVAQLRKANCDFYYVSQWNTGVDHRIRKLTDYVTKCRAIRDEKNPDQYTNLLGARYKKYDAIDEEIISDVTVPAGILRFYYQFYNTRHKFIPEYLEEVTT